MTLAGKASWRALGLLLLILLHNPACFGQEPRIAGTGPTISVSFGYAYLNSEVPAVGKINENGIASGAETDFTRRFGIKLDASYTRANPAFGVDHHSDLLAYLGGPVFYPIRSKRFALYTHALFGAARITGVILEANGDFLTGETNRFAWAVGSGVDTKISRSTVLRVGADYLQASYFTPSSTIRAQGNIRAIATLVYTLGGRR